MRIRTIAGFLAGFGLLSLVGISVSGLGLYDAPANGGQAAADAPASGRISSLSAIESVIGVTYADVSHIGPDELKRLAGDGDELVLLDVREEDEYQVSHISGAVRVSPAASVEDVLKAAGTLKGRTVVVYCSVGARSSTLARKAQSSLKKTGAAGVYNLSGGIFRWHNESRKLINAAGETQLVHKFDPYWGQLVQRQELAVSEPQLAVGEPFANESGCD